MTRYFAGTVTQNGDPAYVWDSSEKKSVCWCDTTEAADLICDALNEKHEREQAYVAARSVI